MSEPAVTFDALAIDHAGAPVRLQQRTLAPLNSDELVVRVAYASINKMDAGLAQRNLFQLPEPYVLGFDFSGEVVRAGASASGSFKPGDQVFGRSETGGCFAELVIAKAENTRVRGAIPAAEASTYGIAFLTAYESLVATADVAKHAGTWIYVAGAGGGVGHFAAQIARLHGLQVIGSAGKPDSLRLLHDLRLDAVIDHARQDVVAEVLRITGGKGADLVYDSTYTQSSYLQSAAVVAAGGEYIRLGTELQLSRAGAGDMTPVVEARGAKLVIADLGRYRTDPKYIARMPEITEGQQRAITWYEEAKLRPVITSVVPFDAAALQQAFEAFSSGVNNVGKVVVKVRS
jgi:NADPH:quinone reductase-like Zn-dependent oxidoreductase